MNAHQLTELTSAQRFQALMKFLGFRPKLTPAVLEAALSLRAEHLPREQLLTHVKHFFSQTAVFIPLGLEDLPSTWLSQLPDIIWATRKSEWTTLPYFVRAVGIEDGSLRIAFSNEQPITPDRISRWDQLRISLNLSLQPNLWFSLSMEDERAIWCKWPGLRRELLTVAGTTDLTNIERRLASLGLPPFRLLLHPSSLPRDEK